MGQWQHCSQMREQHMQHFLAHTQHLQLVENHYKCTKKGNIYTHADFCNANCNAVSISYTYNILCTVTHILTSVKRRKKGSHTKKTVRSPSHLCAAPPLVCSYREMDLSIKAVVYSHTVTIEHSIHAASLSF